MAKGDLLGHIDCPACGTKGGMRVTEDKNGNPFGYCEATCNQQMRIGGSAHRVAQFYSRHPHLKRPDPGHGVADIPPQPQRSGLGSALELLGVK